MEDIRVTAGAAVDVWDCAAVDGCGDAAGDAIPVVERGLLPTTSADTML
jgi:hypothetical protein